MEHKIKNIIALSVSLVVSVSLFAQEGDGLNTPAAYEQMKIRNQWHNTTNSAGLFLDRPKNYTELNVGYELYTGSFHRPQEGENGNNLNVGAEGSVVVNKIYMWGKFDYTRSTIKDANFNSSIIDPFRGMPYILADVNKSEWRNQSYDFSFKVASPKQWNKLSLGIEGGYVAKSGAKQRDIRAENYYYTATIKPGIAYSINDQHHVGVNFEYYSLKEESKNSIVNAADYKQYYELFGLGSAYSQLGSGKTTNYEGNNVGGGLQYNYQGIVNLLLSGTYNLKVEDVSFSFTDPLDQGTTKDKIWNTKLQLYKDVNNVTHFISADYTNRKIDGIEYITQYDTQNGYVTLGKFVKSNYKTQIAVLDYDLSINNNQSHEYLWKFGAGVKYSEKKDLYLLPYSEKNAQNIAYQLRAKRNFILSNNALMKRFLLAADYSYSRNISGKYDYNGSYPTYPVVTLLEAVDAAYLRSDFYSIGATATYSQKIKETLLPSVYLKAEFRYTKAIASQFSNRHNLLVSFGFNF